MLFRRFSYHTLSVFLFVFLILAAWSAALTITFSRPAKLEAWLSQSKLYDHFVATAIDQSQKSVQNGAQDNGSSNGGLDLKDPGVQEAAKAAVTPEVLQKSVNTFLDANYAWLEGTTAKPEFTIDLTGVKAALAANMGAYAQKRALTLPKCATIVQAAQQTDYLTATCLPPGITPAAVAQSVEQQIADSQDFLPNPVITAQTFNQTGQDQQAAQNNRPYYQKLSSLPAGYRVATKIPWLVTILALLSAAGVILLAATRRKGFHRIGTLLMSTGLIILLLIFISSAVLHRLENKVFTNDKVGQLQQSLVDFAHRAQSALANVDLWFGVSFIVVGAAIYAALQFTKSTTPKPPAAPEAAEEPVAPEPPKPKRPTLIQL